MSEETSTVLGEETTTATSTTETVPNSTEETTVVEQPTETTPDGAGETVSFIDSLPESLRGNERFTGIESVEDLAQKFAEVDIAATVPDAGDYVVPEGLPTQLGEVANKLGLTQEQLDGTTLMYSEYNQAVDIAQREEMAIKADELLESWGEDKDKNLSLSKRAVNYVAEGIGEDLREFFKETGAGNNPMVIKAFNFMGRVFDEGGHLPSLPNTPKAKKSAAATMFPNHPTKE